MKAVQFYLKVAPVWIEVLGGTTKARSLLKAFLASKIKATPKRQLQEAIIKTKERYSKPA